MGKKRTYTSGDADICGSKVKRRRVSIDTTDRADHNWRQIDSEVLHAGLNRAIDDDNPMKLAELLKNWKDINSETICNIFWAAFNRRQIGCIGVFMDANLVPNPNLYPLNHTLPLFDAITADDIEMVDILCSSKFETRIVSLENGETPLHRAVQKGNVKSVDILLRCGFDPNTVTPNGEYPLHVAIRCHHEEVALNLMDATAKAGQPMPECRTTPLMRAAMTGNKRLVDALLNKKIKIDARDMFRETALFKAVCYNKVEIVKMLIEKRAKPDVKVMMPDEEEPHRDEWGDTPLTVAVYSGAEDMVKLLLDTKKVNVNYCCNGEGTHIQLAIRGKNKTIIKHLMDAGADVTKRTPQNRNSLHFLSETRSDPADEELAKTLIELGCDVALVDDTDGITPLFNAIWYNNITVAKCMIQANTPVDARDSRMEKSLIEIALDRKYLDIASFLIKAGCNLSIVRKHKMCTDYNGKFVNWLHKQLHCPKNLKSICRQLIRKSIGVPFIEKLSVLKLPNDIKQFLMLAELDSWQDYRFPVVKENFLLRWPRLRKIWECVAYFIYSIPLLERHHELPDQ